MKRRIGILTSGGDCPGLNAAIRGVAKASYSLFDAEIVGIMGGYRGMIEGEYRTMDPSDLSGILTLGGTILGTSRQPYRQMRVVGEDNIDKIDEMKKNYKKMKLDCLVTIGGNGTHKSAALLAQEGLNVIGLPKTIDNDIYGTDVTFGFQTAVDIATDVVDRIHTTACSHNRIMIIELMGNKAGYLTLYAGVAGGADVILLPEIPFETGKVIDAIRKRGSKGKNFSIIAIAEGAMLKEEAELSKKQRKELQETPGRPSVGFRLAEKIQEKLENETRVVVPGHIQRGGSPCPFDRVLATRLGTFGAMLIRDEDYGKTVAIQGEKTVANRLVDIAGVPKRVPDDHELILSARSIGTNFGD